MRLLWFNLPVHGLSLEGKVLALLGFQSLILLLFALFSEHSDPPGREQDQQNKTSNGCR